MKKYTILLLVSSLLSLGTTQAATQNITKCYGQSVTLKATKTGNSYQWYKDGTAINGETQNEYKVTNLEKSAKYECKITTNGGSKTTNFLKSTNGTDYGDFEFPASQATSWDQYKKEFPVRDEIRNETYTARIELKKFMQDGVCDAGESTTTKNPNLIKPAWFNSTSAYQNNYMLAVDGPQANAGAFEFFEVYDLKLKAGQEYEFSCYIVNIDAKYTQAGRSLPQLQFKLVQGGNVLHSGNLFTIKPDLNKWDKYYVTYTPSQDVEYVKLIISNQTQGQDGNDFAIDAVYFGAKQTTASTSVTDVFNVTVYDTFTYDFKTDEVCPGEQATITTTLKPAHGGTLEPTSNYKYEWQENGKTQVVSTSKDLVVTAPNSVGTFPYVLSTSSSVCYTSGAKSQTTSVKTKDCGTTETNNHPAVTVCTNQNVTLKCDKTGNSVTWNDPSLTGTEVTVTSSSSVGAEDKYTCTIISTENGNTVTYIETFTVKTKDCSITIESTMCNNAADSTLKASKAGTNYEYVWTMPNESTRTTKTDTIHIKPANANVGDVLKYSCKIYEIPYSNPDPSAPIAGRPPMLLGTDNFEITIRDCIVETDDEEDLQTKEDGSITLIVPEANRCDDCTYTWYKRNEDGSKGEAVAKNAGEAAWQHTVYNATADEYMCEIITPNGNKHTQTYKISVYTPKTSTYCFTADSENEQKVTITTLTKADRDEYEWYWKKDNEEVPFPEGAISTEENTITLDTEYFANSNSNFPVKVHIVEKFAHKLDVRSTETPGDNNGTETPIAPEEPSISPDPDDDPITPAPDPMEPSISPAPSGRGININSSGLSKDKARQVNDSTLVYSYTIIDETQNPQEVTVEDKFVVNPNCKYDETFPPKSAGMSSHDCNVRLTNIGINGCSAYKVDDPNNEYFIEVDGGDKQGPVFSIKQPGKLIKGEKYILRFLARETSTVAGNPKTTSPAKIDFSITYGDKRDALTTVQTIDTQDWNAYVFTYIAKHDCEDVIITLSNYNTESGYNDFAIDEITFTLANEGNNSAKRNATALNNDDVIDEDGDGFVMWKNEHILYIYPHTTQTIIETSGPHKEYEKEVELPIGETITFRYDPSIYQEGMTEYKAEEYRTDEYGCNHTVYFTLNLIELEPDLYFTPNDDGVHDKWMVKGIETAPNAYIMIYDRHSKLLYKSIGADFQGWDGNYNGHGMVQDDYWYVILVPETEETLSGHFTLKR